MKKTLALTLAFSLGVVVGASASLQAQRGDTVLVMKSDGTIPLENPSGGKGLILKVDFATGVITVQRADVDGTLDAKNPVTLGKLTPAP